MACEDAAKLVNKLTSGLHSCAVDRKALVTSEFDELSNRKFRLLQPVVLGANRFLIFEQNWSIDCWL